MKYLALVSVFICFVFLGSTVAANDGAKIPSANIKDLKGQVVKADALTNNGKPMIVSFWATWCKPCIQELNNIHDLYADWQKETGVKLVAVSIDDARNSSKVAPFIKGRGWQYEVYLDENSDLKRKMNVNNVPHTFLLDGNGNIVWQHTSYAPGDEEHLYELVKKLAQGEKISE